MGESLYSNNVANTIPHSLNSLNVKANYESNSKEKHMSTMSNLTDISYATNLNPGIS